MYGDASVFETPEARDASSASCAPWPTRRRDALAAALLTPLRRTDRRSDLLAVRGDERAWDAWVERFQALERVLGTSGFTVAFRRLLDEPGCRPHPVAPPDGERRLTNVLHLGELLQQAAVEGRRGPLALVEWLQRMRSDAARAPREAAESAQIRLESDAHALKLITIHKSKGLEYPVVICPFLWDGTSAASGRRDCAAFHDPADGDRLTLDLGSADAARHRQLAEREALAENLRLLYVALTRAAAPVHRRLGRVQQLRDIGARLPAASAARRDATSDLTAATRSASSELSDARCAPSSSAGRGVANGAIAVVDLPPARRRATRSSRRTDRRSTLALRTRARCCSLAHGELLGAGRRRRVLPEPAEEGVDRDELADERDSDAAPSDAGAVRGFPRGRRLGKLVHKLFETIDFAALRPRRAARAGASAAAGLRRRGALGRGAVRGACATCSTRR